jgi:hypothetical protein
MSMSSFSPVSSIVWYKAFKLRIILRRIASGRVPLLIPTHLHPRWWADTATSKTTNARKHWRTTLFACDTYTLIIIPFLKHAAKYGMKMCATKRQRRYLKLKPRLANSGHRVAWKDNLSNRYGGGASTVHKGRWKIWRITSTLQSKSLRVTDELLPDIFFLI